MSRACRSTGSRSSRAGRPARRAAGRRVSGPGAARRVPLPTYAFQHQSYWPQLPPTTAGDVTAAGLAAADHPLLGATVELPDSGGLLFTGRLSLDTHPWLAEHSLAGEGLVHGTGFCDLA